MTDVSAVAAIFDWAERLSKRQQLERAISDTRAEFLAVGTRCGGCDHWMKSRECPLERNVNGQKGPSMNARICGKYEDSAFSISWRENRAAKLRDLLAERRSLLQNE